MLRPNCPLPLHLTVSQTHQSMSQSLIGHVVQMPVGGVQFPEVPESPAQPPGLQQAVEGGNIEQCSGMRSG
jgi:hypothetical protein